MVPGRPDDIELTRPEGWRIYEVLEDAINALVDTDFVGLLLELEDVRALMAGKLVQEEDG
jgi:hypothetical protein